MITVKKINVKRILSGAHVSGNQPSCHLLNQAEGASQRGIEEYKRGWNQWTEVQFGDRF